MSERTELLPSSFCWPELASPDPAKAKQFFAGLFAWEGHDVPSSDGTYTLLRLRGKDVSGLRAMTPDEKERGVPAHFLTYVSTASADTSAAKAAELGGTVLTGPFDVPGIGRMAVIQDPEGVVFALWEARGHIGAQLVGEEGALCWTELVTRRPDEARAFYGGLFGWTFRASEAATVEYYEIYREGQPIGGLLPMKGEWWGDVGPHFMPYFLVTDCDAAVKRAAELDGGVAVPTTEIPHVGRFAVLCDTQGAPFSVIAPVPVEDSAA